MRILDEGVRSLDEIELHLTADEARQIIAGLTDCLDDLASIGMESSHWPIADGVREAVFHVHSSRDGLEEDVMFRIREG